MGGVEKPGLPYSLIAALVSAALIIGVAIAFLAIYH